ncbi:unnamed protein product [Adineta ricciae]|uniref:alpha-1,2-Mannosidase n=1 Tax=Adineta ricciae TaxID=249248 RepID=A0A816ANZ0_ADIRI|nr:unnamed protein product [Adineta ricciae]
MFCDTKTIVLLISFFITSAYSNEGQFSKQKQLYYKSRVKQMFYHAYDSYLKFAYPYDELRPLTCDGYDTWGSYSLSLVDAIDTLATLGNNTEFARVYTLIQNLDIERDINVSVFETNIRVIGGLLSAHLLAKRMNVPVNATWPCTGPLLDLAVALANKVLPAFDTATGNYDSVVGCNEIVSSVKGIPYGTVNLVWGVPVDETNITCTAGGGTFLIEFGTLSRLTGDPVYERVALRALKSLWSKRSAINLVGNHINIQTGAWTANDCTIGSGVDSYFEYLVKGAILLRQPDLMDMMSEYIKAIDKHLSDGSGWFVFANYEQGRKTMPLFASLDAFYPGLLTLVGELDRARETLYAYHTMWRKFGSMPEFYNLVQQDCMQGREAYPLRPEHIESIMYLYKATKDDTLLFMAADIFDAIESCCKTSCGYTSLKNVKDHQLDNRMESFFLAETIKYLYLIFDEENFLHSNGEYATEHYTSSGSCFLETSFVYNTEAHPIDIGALDCCTPSFIKEKTSAKVDENTLTKEQMRWLRDSLLNEELNGAIKKNFSTLTCSALAYEQRFSIYGEILTFIRLFFIMVWEFIKRHRRKLYIISLLAGGGYAAARFLNRKLSTMLNEQDKMLSEWKKQLYYEHNRDTSLRTSTDIFAQVVLNINRSFQCESILAKLPTITDSTQKRELWEQLRTECFARLFTLAYSSSFVLALTELVVSALSGRLYSQSQIQQSLPSSTTAPGGVSATSKSTHAESTQSQNSLLSREIQLACLDVIRYTTEAGMNCLIDDIRKATQSILSRIPLSQMLDINDIMWYCSEVRHQIEKKRYQTTPNHYPLLKYVRSNAFPARPNQPATTTSSSAYSMSNILSTTSSLFTTRTHSPPSVFNVQQQFEIECIEMIESETFQRVLIQIIDQSFSNIYDEFAREMVKPSMTNSSADDKSANSTIIVDSQLPLAKIVPMSNNIYSKLSSQHEQLMLHFQNLACCPELHEYTKYAYDLFSNESLQSASRTAFSFLPSPSASSLQANFSSFLQSLMSPQ